MLLLLLQVAAAASSASPPLVRDDSANHSMNFKPPPMGWMSWEVFRCEVDCGRDPANCIGERLYTETADALVDGGYLEAGYSIISIDDCYMAWSRVEGELQFNATRFPSGPSKLSAYFHDRGLKFGLYEDEGTLTCQGYPGSKDHEATDAATFRAWGVDYVKFDGCYDDAAGFAEGYPKMGRALGGNITYSCSWPAYIGDDETTKPFQAFVDAGCDLWRNWHDVQCEWSSLSSIIDHWGNYSAVLRQWRGNDPDMLLVGNDCVTHAEQETQFALWCIVAAPLVMGNDLRRVPDKARALLLNDEAIAVNQDGSMPGGRASNYSDDGSELWLRPDLQGGESAVALLNKKNASQLLTLDLASVGLDDHQARVSVRDVLRKTTLGIYDRNTTLDFLVPAHGVAFLRLSPLRVRGGGGTYPSSSPRFFSSLS